jgi:Pentapeptide repeats (8 copies)
VSDEATKKKVKFEISSWWTGKILFAGEYETQRRCLEDAVAKGTNLHRASLDGARLVGARLDGARLVGARLDGARLDRASLVGASGLEKFPIQIGGHKHWLITTPGGDLQIGCHVYTFAEWKRHAEKIGKTEGYSALEVEIYKLHIEHIEKISRLLWNYEK